MSVIAKPLLIYDAACRFCRFGIDVVRRLDRRTVFEFCPFGHPTAERILDEAGWSDHYGVLATLRRL